jgi:hypothetical protein
MFNITIETTVNLSAKEVWPDGDAPENPTAQDVADKMVASGGTNHVIKEWNLQDAWNTQIYVNGVEVWK